MEARAVGTSKSGPTRPSRGNRLILVAALVVLLMVGLWFGVVHRAAGNARFASVNVITTPTILGDGSIRLDPPPPDAKPAVDASTAASLAEEEFPPIKGHTETV